MKHWKQFKTCIIHGGSCFPSYSLLYSASQMQQLFVCFLTNLFTDISSLYNKKAVEQVEVHFNMFQRYNQVVIIDL